MLEARKVHWVALELELQMIGNRPMDAGNFIQDPLKKQQLLLTAEPSFCLLVCFLETRILRVALAVLELAV